MSDAPSPAPAHATAAPTSKQRPKIPAFARYEGTSAWRKDRRRVRAFAWYKANEAKKAARVTAP